MVLQAKISFRYSLLILEGDELDFTISQCSIGWRKRKISISRRKRSVSKEATLTEKVNVFLSSALPERTR